MHGQNNLSENEKFTVTRDCRNWDILRKCILVAKHTYMYSIHSSTKKIWARLYLHVATVHTILTKILRFTEQKSTLVFNKLTLYVIPQSVHIIHLELPSVHSCRFSCLKLSPNKQSLANRPRKADQELSFYM